MAAGRVYWVDRCLGADIVPQALRAVGVTIATYKDLYPNDPAIADSAWIPQVTARGWIILTKDKRIRFTPAEIEALRGAGARYGCLAAGNIRGEEQAACLVRHWKTIDGVVATRPAPLIVSVTREHVQWLDRGAWRAVKRKR